LACRNALLTLSLPEDPTTSRSLVDSRISQARSAALQSTVAFNILDYVYAESQGLPRIRRHYPTSTCSTHAGLAGGRTERADDGA